MKRSQKTIVLGSIAAIAFGALSSLIFPLYATVLGALILPFLVILALRCGGFCASLAVALLALTALSRAGWMGLLAVLLLVPAPTALIALLLSRKAKIYHCTYYSAAALTAGIILFWIAYSAYTGSDPATDAANALSQALLSLTATDLANPATQQWQGALSELMKEVQQGLRMQVLPHVIGVACLAALLGTVLPVAYMKKRALSDQVSRISPLPYWRIPRKLAVTLMLTYVGSYLLALFGVGGMMTVSQVTWRVVEVVYGASCLGLIAHKMHAIAVGKGARNLVLLLAVLLMAFLRLLGFIGSLPFVIAGILGEGMRLRTLPNTAGRYGPFGPPDPPPQQEDGRP